MNAPQWHAPSRLITIDAGTTEGVEAPETAHRVALELAAESSAFLYRPSGPGRKVLTHLPADAAVVAVLPDLPKLLRDTAERGVLNAALERLAGAGIGTWWRLAKTGIRHARRIAVQDLEGLIPVLIELERVALGGRAIRGVALSAPLTDLLLAAGHRECFAHVVGFLRRQIGTHAGFETLNLGHLLTKLDTWGVAPDFVIGPLNPRGFRMKPSEQAVLEAVRVSRAQVLAAEVTACGTVSLAYGVAHARQAGATGVVLTLGDLTAEEL